ncbi:hypothetical protein ENSA5_36420 [Enhygromyxa salina]|uniref:HEAT repeat protein n=1 Tax=Enhygromyxa salina TaxID=215803 RepID=A0A2S9XUM0_9BACT|nr:hypothetical protein [Enhygromyxa salina]PRP96566.1 hypothetical protein ENSA5_36420 [Enhygromyxa salina]
MQRFIGIAPRVVSRRTNERILDRHVDEIAMTWSQRDRACRSHHYRLRELIMVDERVSAHIEGGRLGGARAWQLAFERIEAGEPGTMFAAAALALAGSEARWFEELGQLARAQPELGRELVAGIAWARPSDVSWRLAALARSDQRHDRRLAAAGFGVSGIIPPRPREWLESDDPELVQETLRIVGERGLVEFVDHVNARLDDPVLATRFHAARSALLLDRRHAAVWSALEACMSEPRYAQAAVRWYLRHQDTEAGAASYRMYRERPQLTSLALHAAIGHGRIGVVDDLITLMHEPEHARLAGIAFSVIVGVDVEYADLDLDEDQAEPEDEDPGIDEIDVERFADPLPRPDPEAVRVWWAAHAGEFDPNQRYLRGRAIDESSLRETLVAGTQFERMLAAEDLAALRRGSLYLTRQPGQRQARDWLGW